MTINELKEYIYNENKIEYILKQLGCHEIKYNAQKEYFREMMAIKGEMGTLLPKWAQQHFLPPQIRASTWDLIKRAKQEKWKASKLALMLLDRMKFWKIREDDTDFITSTQHGDYDNTPLRDIPIFYAHPLNNQDELLKDFSSALESFLTLSSPCSSENSSGQYFLVSSIIS
jgi:hypothetical protein